MDHGANRNWVSKIGRFLLILVTVYFAVLTIAAPDGLTRTVFASATLLSLGLCVLSFWWKRKRR